MKQKYITTTTNQKKRAFDDFYIKYESEADKKESMKQYLKKIRSYLGKIIDNFRASGRSRILVPIKTSLCHHKLMKKNK